MMKNTNSKSVITLSSLAVSSLLAFTPLSYADDKKTEKELEKQQKEQSKEIEKKKSGSRFQPITLSKDKETYTIDGYEEEGEKSVDGETFYVKTSKLSSSKKKREYKSEQKVFRLEKLNRRDGFYLAYSAISTAGDDIYTLDDANNTEYDTHLTYRIQLASFFVESPGLNSRRMHGLYASNAWGFNFYDGENWSFDLYKQFNTEKVEGIAQIQNRNTDRRGGIRATGYFDNSQLQFIFSPYSRAELDDDGIEASVSYTHYWQVKNWNIYGSLGAQYQSEEIVSYGAQDLVNDQSRVNTSVELGVEYALSESWVLGGFAAYNEVPSQSTMDDVQVNAARAGVLLSLVF